MGLLARREHSQAELRLKLKDREYSEPEIAVALEGLLRDGLISDERFAEAFVAARVRRGQGPIRIRVELERRGVSAELIVTYLSVRESEWVDRAEEVRRKKFGVGQPSDFKEKARQARFLQYRGFSGEHIQRVLNDFGD
jgi:regulatory protein